MNPNWATSFTCRIAGLLTIVLLFVSAADTAVDPRVSAFLQNYCIDCHGPKKATYYLEPGDRVLFRMIDGAPNSQAALADPVPE